MMSSGLTPANFESLFRRSLSRRAYWRSTMHRFHRCSLLTVLSMGVCIASLAALPTDAIARKNAHGQQGTGNYKGKKDKHEKPGPDNEKKKQSPNWTPLKK